MPKAVVRKIGIALGFAQNGRTHSTAKPDVELIAKRLQAARIDYETHFGEEERQVSLIEARGLSQSRAADLLEVSQPKISALKNEKPDGFSVERLIHFLPALGQDVEIRIKPHGKARVAGRIRVQAA